MLKIRKIEIMLNSNLLIATQILRDIKHFICISRTILAFVILFAMTFTYFFISYAIQNANTDNETIIYAVWVPIIQACLFYLLIIWVCIYFVRMGTRWTKQLKSDGYDINT